MKDYLVPILIAVIGSTGFFSFLQFLIQRYGFLQDLYKKIKYIDQGNVRLQLMVLIHLYPQRNEEIIKLAKQYFCDFQGNYYLTTIFKQYLDDHHLTYPQWFIQYKN